MAALHCTQCGLEQPPDARFCPGCGLAIAVQRDELVGQVVADRYRLLERIGQGGSGTVYRAEHTTLAKKVAVKILHHQLSRDESAIERFRREATTVADLDNDHILEVSDFGRAADGRLFFAMELLDGKPLAEVIEKEQRLSVTRAVDIAIQIGEALVEAHGLGYVHRDLKPRNVFLIQRRGRADFVKLLDFGLAKLVEPTGQMKQTAMGLTFGDPRYMAPEAVRGDAIDRRVDVYALGAILFEMLTGSPPYEGTGTFDILQKQMDDAVPKLRDRRPELPEWLERVVQKALAKKPDDRHVTALKLIEQLRAQGATTSERDEATATSTAKTVVPGAATAAAPPAVAAAPPAVAAVRAQDEPRPATSSPTVGSQPLSKDTMLLGKLRSPAESEKPNGEPAPSISPIASTQKGPAVGSSATKTPDRPGGQGSNPGAKKNTNSGRVARIEGVNVSLDAPDKGAVPVAVTASGEAGPTPRLTPKDAGTAPSTSGEMSIGDRNRREPSQKVPSVMFDSAVEAMQGPQNTRKPAVDKASPRKPGAVAARPPGKPASKALTDSGEQKKPQAAAAEVVPPSGAPVIEASEPRRDEPSGESEWFKTGPQLLSDEEELEPIQKSRAGMYAGLGVGGVLAAGVLIIALWPRAPKKAAAESPEKPAAAATAAAAPAPIVTPLPTPAPAAPNPAPAAPTPTPTPAPTPVAVAPTPAPPPVAAAPPKPEPKVEPPRHEDKKHEHVAPPVPVAASPKEGKDSKPTKDVKATKVAPTKQALEELKPATPAKPGKALPAGFKDPFAEQPVAGNPRQAEGLVKLGRQKLSSGDLGGAQAQFNKAREADPNSADALAGLGEVAFEQGDYGGAAGYLKQALRSSPNRPRYIVLLGQAYYKIGRVRDAANEYRRALRLDPDNEEAQRSLELAEKKLQ